jgi:HPt (histidine-containing phosphotransfer) domain-containing protein
MSWIDYLWPFGAKRKERLAREKQVEDAFKKQLEAVEKSKGDLKTLIARMKKEREERQSDRARRKTLPSIPTIDVAEKGT